jgi:CRISPR/Cas system-associated exonuclease Cas4 (RecB family)
MATFRNELTWSKTRDETLRSCPRRYWFQYYGSWGGWDWHAPYRVRQIYMLKQLQNRWAWIGVRVHETMEALLTTLRSGELLPDVDQVCEHLLQRLRRDFRSSRDGHYRQNPKQNVGLLEHEYKREVAAAEWKRLADLGVACVRTFYELPLRDEFESLTTDQWLELEELNSFQLEGTKVWVSLDACFQRAEQLVLIDWKTGRSEDVDHSLQMGIYALYASDRWGVDPRKLLLREVYLASGEVREYESGMLKLKDVMHYVGQSVRAMKALLRDVEKNVAAEEDFGFTEDEAQCHQCNFRKVCPKWEL